MKYFKTKGGELFYSSNLMIDVDEESIVEYYRIYDEDLHIRITREEFVTAYEQLINKLNEKVYGSEQKTVHG